jgi:hypothetical protein
MFSILYGVIGFAHYLDRSKILVSLFRIAILGIIIGKLSLAFISFGMSWFRGSGAVRSLDKFFT